jgi:DNA mismatch repair protein MutS
MYRKYHEVWSAHTAKYGPRTALLYQVGKFYEIYDTENLTTGATQCNIREIADICQLSLTQHLSDDGLSQTLFGGVPEVALAKYEKILVQAGWTVVVVVQKKDNTGAVEERVVEHISSPGCFVEGVKERRLVGCILESMSDGPAALRKLYWAVCALDIATGRIWFTEGGGNGNPDRLHQFLCMHPPTELVIWSDGLPAAATLTESLKGASAAVHVKCLGPASVAVDESMLARFWTVKLLTWAATAPQARRCLAALMGFASDHVPSALKSLEEPEAWVPDNEVRLGNAALEQLGLLHMQKEQEGLLGLMDKCRSVAGRRLMRSRLIRPLSCIATLEARLDRIEEVRSLEPATIERGLRSLYDISRLWRRVELGTASFSDMSCLLRSYEAAQTLGFAAADFFAAVFGQWKVGTLVELARAGVGVPTETLPFSAGHPVFEEGLAIRAAANVLIKSYSPDICLDDAEGGGFRITGTKKRINAVWTRLRDEGVGATVVAYKSNAALETPDLEAISKRHRAWLRIWTPIWESLWSTALSDLLVWRSTSATLESWCADLDVSWTVGRIAAEWSWVRPVFVSSETSSVEVEGLRHPILERLTRVPYVSHSLTLGKGGQGILLYGMNASGKSSLMKALGLCVMLAQAGFPVPASSLRLAPFTAIFTRILGNDNLWAGLSSFAVEMTEFREILQFADERSLILGDELCSGTESLSATALVAAGIETLADRGSTFVFATHLHELAALIPAAVRAMHLRVSYDAATDQLIYDRRLESGPGSALYGLEVCRALDLPHGYLDRATAIRNQLAGAVVPHRSVYSADVVMDRCSVCAGKHGLEAHHIQHQAAGGDNKAGNLVCLCTRCHDDHHGGRLVIEGWKETATGRILAWNRPVVAAQEDDVKSWVREQKRLKIRVATIQRVAKQKFGADLTGQYIKSVSV